MNKIKKIFASLGMLIAASFTKICGIISRAITPQPLYGVTEEDKGEKILDVLKWASPFFIFIIGIIVILNKKISSKTKNIVIAILIVIETVALIFSDLKLLTFMMIIAILGIYIIFNDKVNKKTKVVFSIILALLEIIGITFILMYYSLNN